MKSLNQIYETIIENSINNTSIALGIDDTIYLEEAKINAFKAYKNKVIHRVVYDIKTLCAACIYLSLKKKFGETLLTSVAKSINVSREKFKLKIYWLEKKLGLAPKQTIKNDCEAPDQLVKIAEEIISQLDIGVSKVKYARNAIRKIYSTGIFDYALKRINLVSAACVYIALNESHFFSMKEKDIADQLGMKRYTLMEWINKIKRGLKSKVL